MRNLMLRRRALEGSKRLPDGFQEVAWIQVVNNTQWFDSGIVTNSKQFVAKLKFELTDDSSAQNRTNIFSNYVDDNTNITRLWVQRLTTPSETQGMYSPLAAAKWKMPYLNVYHYAGTIYEEEFGYDYLITNGIRHAYESGGDGTPNPNSIIIFNGRQHTNGLLAKYYYIQFYDSGSAILDLVPCYRKSDNAIGMYDLVSGTFFTNQGTGTFTKGANVN